MPIESLRPNIENEKKDDDPKSLVEHLNNLRLIVGRVLSGDIETGSGVSSTVGSRRFDPQNQTTRQTVVTDDTVTSDDPSDDSSQTESK